MSGTRQITLLSSCALLLALQGCGGASTESPTSTPGAQSGSDAVEQSYLPSNDTNSGGDELSPTVNMPTDTNPVDLNTGPEGDSQVTFDEQSYHLNAGLGDVWGIEDDHYEIAFTLTNGKFKVTPTEVDGVAHNLLVPVNATAVFYAELHSPGDSFSFTTYSHSPFGAGGGVLAGNAFFKQAYVDIDHNNSGQIEPDERMPVTGGTVEFAGVLPDIELLFNVTVENGQSVEGHYTGLFDFTDRF